MPPTTFKGLVNHLLELIGLAIPTLIGIVFVIFAWKIFSAWVLHADDEKKRAEGRQLAVVGVVVFVIMFTVWGIVTLLRTSLFGA